MNKLPLRSSTYILKIQITVENKLKNEPTKNKLFTKTLHKLDLNTSR